MNKIFDDAKDKNVACVLVYVADSDTKAYGDEDCTKQLTQSELYDAYVKGCLVVDEDGVLYSPISYAVESGVGTLTYAVPTTSEQTTTLVVATAVSSVDPA